MALIDTFFIGYYNKCSPFGALIVEMSRANLSHLPVAVVSTDLEQLESCPFSTGEDGSILCLKVCRGRKCN